MKPLAYLLPTFLLFSSPKTITAYLLTPVLDLLGQDKIFDVANQWAAEPGFSLPSTLLPSTNSKSKNDN